MKTTIKAKQIIFCAVPILIIFAVYVSKLTTFGLWYDEGIEYFYSKYMFGSLPVNVEPNDVVSQNMYQRICLTYQPPLYNFLMYFWLQMADSEAWFRFAGVLTTFIGAIGLFCALKKVTNHRWAVAGTIVYLTTWSVRYYALECAEYNLMLCMESWALYFLCSLYVDSEYAKKRKHLIGFLLFACLSAYSQYGAILLMVPLYVVLLSYYLIAKDKLMVRDSIIGAVIVFIIAALPLLYFFLLPQMGNQKSISVSHAPVFVDGVFYSLINGVNHILTFNFGGRMKYIVVLALLFILLSAVYFKSKKLAAVIGVSILVYAIYFVLVACSLYAYNNWDGRLGCNNFGGRYTLFMSPLLIIMIVFSLYVILGLISQIKIDKIMKIGTLGLFMAFSLFGLIKLAIAGSGSKGNTREIYNIWLKEGGDINYTLIMASHNPVFQFYYLHGSKKNHPNNVIGEGQWSRKATTEDIERNLAQLGAFEHKTIYYIGSQSFYNINDHQKRFDKAMALKGYSVKYLYNKNEVLAEYERN